MKKRDEREALIFHSKQQVSILTLGIPRFSTASTAVSREPVAYRHTQPGTAATHLNTPVDAMIVRPQQGPFASTALASVALLVIFPAALISAAAPAAPVVVTNYKQLVGTIGSNNNYGTGERFYRCVQQCIEIGCEVRSSAHTLDVRSGSG